MPLPVYTHSPISIHPLVAQPLRNVVEDAPRHALPTIRELAGVLGTTPNTVARAIEDLTRSGYRPLHANLVAPEPSSISRGCPLTSGLPSGDDEADAM